MNDELERKRIAIAKGCREVMEKKTRLLRETIRRKRAMESTMTDEVSVTQLAEIFDSLDPESVGIKKFPHADFKLITGKLDAGQTIPMILHCPECGARHIDEADFAEVAHHTHACQGCGFVWRPAKVNTHGVQFLPGYSNAEREQ